jgi:hypothetical protein
MPVVKKKKSWEGSHYFQFAEETAMGTGTGSVQLSDMLHTYVHSRTLFSNWLLPPGYSEKWRTQNEIEPINTSENN